MGQRQFLHRTRRPVDVRRPQPRPRHVIAASEVQRQVAVPVKETTLLVVVQRVVGGVDVRKDLLRRRRKGFEEKLKFVHRVGDGPFASIRLLGHAWLEPVQGDWPAGGPDRAPEPISSPSGRRTPLPAPADCRPEARRGR